MDDSILVKLPRALVEKLLNNKPSHIMLYNGESVEPYIDLDGSDLFCDASDFSKDKEWMIRWMVNAAQAMQCASLVNDEILKDSIRLDKLLNAPRCGRENSGCHELKETDGVKCKLLFQSWVEPDEARKIIDGI